MFDISFRPRSSGFFMNWSKLSWTVTNVCFVTNNVNGLLFRRQIKIIREIRRCKTSTDVPKPLSPLGVTSIIENEIITDDKRTRILIELPSLRHSSVRLLVVKMCTIRAHSAFGRILVLRPA